MDISSCLKILMKLKEGERALKQNYIPLAQRPPLKQNVEVANLLQELSNSFGEREGQDALFDHTNEYINGVKKAIPDIEQALNNLKTYIEYFDKKQKENNRRNQFDYER